MLNRLGKRTGVGQVADANAASGDLVLVRRADAARGRADLPLTAARLAEEIQLAMVRQDEMGLVADDQAIADGDAGALELVDLGEQRLRIDDHAVADDTGDALVQDAGRQQAQDELAARRVHGMTGVVASLVSGDDREVRRQEIDDLALAFVTPLCAQHGDVHK